MQYQGAGPQINPIMTPALNEDEAEKGVPGILKKYHAIMAEIGSIGKDQKNVAQGFKFRGIDQFQNRLHGLLVKHKVILTPQVTHRTDDVIESSNGKKQRAVNLVMKYTFTDIEDGSTLSIMMPSEGLDTGDKATNKALSFNLKYALIQGLMVPTEDMENVDMSIEDGDADSPKLSSASSGPKKAAKKVAKKAPSKNPRRFERPKKKEETEDDDDL